jgi:glycosyltransferase involved in cell wall biosynthesis
MEYMATGIPIVTQEYTGIRELIQDGISGYLAKPDDIQSLSEKIKEAMDGDNRNEAGRRAREYAFCNLTWENRAEKFQQIINEINC